MRGILKKFATRHTITAARNKPGKSPEALHALIKASAQVPLLPMAGCPLTVQVKAKLQARNSSHVHLRLLQAAYSHEPLNLSLVDSVDGDEHKDVPNRKGPHSMAHRRVWVKTASSDTHNRQLESLTHDT